MFAHMPIGYDVTTVGGAGFFSCQTLSASP